MEYHKQHLSIAKDLGDRAEEGRAYSNLGMGYYDLGDYKQAIEYHKQRLSIAKDLGDKAGEGNAYNNLGGAYYGLGYYKQSMDYSKLCLVIAKSLDDKMLESLAYNSIGTIQGQLGDYKKAIEYFEKIAAFSKEQVSTKCKGCAYMNLGCQYNNLGDFKQAIEYLKQALSLLKGQNLRHWEGCVCYNLGSTFENSGALQEASNCYQRSIKIYNDMRVCLQDEDTWKVSFCKTNHEPYTGLWRTLVKLLKFDEALCIAEQGRAQALADLIKLQYDSELSAPSSFDPKAAISSMISDMSTPSLFVALEGNTIYLWLLCKKRNIQFTHKEVKYPLGDVAYYLERLRKDAYKEIRGGFRVKCENRSLDELKEQEEPPSTEEIGAEVVNSSQCKSNSLYLFPELIEGGGEVRVKCENRLLNELREEEDLATTKEIGAGTGNSSQRKSNSLHLFHECIIDPISEFIEGDELIVVPDGPLCLAPFSAFLDSESKYLSESMKIRILPSLTSLKLVEVSPEDYHEKSGALLVGEPCLEQFTSLLGRPLFSPLPNAKKKWR